MARQHNTNESRAERSDMSNENVSEDRRRLLQMTSAGGLALLFSACASSGTDMDEPDVGDPPTNKDLDEVADILWAEFAEGTAHWTGDQPIEMEADAKRDRTNYHRSIVRGNWAKWKKAKRTTRNCAWNAGLLAAMLNQNENQGDKITKDQFIAAARAVRDIQVHRSGKPSQDVGIAC